MGNGRAFARGGVAAVALALLAGTGLGACDGDETEATPTASAGGAGGAGGSGGVGGVVAPSRGDPADFPTACLATCIEACARLDTCGGASSSLYPLDETECLDRCAMAVNGPVWDDVSGNFRCCVSQDDCSLVQHCGGWLDHPAVEGSCDQLCTCFFSAAIAELGAGKVAPPGYRFAGDVVLVDVGGRELPSLRGVRAARTGRYAEVRLAEEAAPDALDRIAEHGTLLPTFRDGAGRLAAAVGKIVLAVPSATVRAAAAGIVARHGGDEPRDLRIAAGVALASFADPWAALAAVIELRAAGIDAELDMLRTLERRYTPNDPLFGDQWHLRNTGQLESVASVDARVSEAWDVTQGDAAVVLAINDDGVDLGHTDFQGKLAPELNYPADWQTQMTQGTFAGHGTSVAGVAAAKADDAAGGAGVCPGCTILPHMLAPVTLTGSFQATDTEVADGFAAQVDAGAWVINNSWGLSLGEPAYVDATLPLPALPQVLAAAFAYAETAGRGGLGTVILYAAGNHNQELDYYATYATNVAVAAVGDNGLKAYYSAFGPQVDVAAPSNGAIAGITTSAAGGGYTDEFGGTSSATPFVSGVFGLVFSVAPGLTAAEARALVASTATPIDPVFGAWQAGHSVYYGAGMVNAWLAVELASGACVDAASCPAPSDDCGPNCGTGTACAPCRTGADCAPGYGCQALPSLGMLTCVAPEGGGCPGGTTAVNGYCLPTPQTCA
ncbi:MAG: S8 family serine peptidase, partial [Polyangiaceae bacterium]|nr:S8 family serine peptidase [Polyangiaceae bacterium]